MNYRMSSKICFVSPYNALTSFLEQTFKDLPEPPQIVEGGMDEARKMVLAAKERGAEVFVTTEHNARSLEGAAVPVVSVTLDTFVIAQALHRAKVRHGEPVGLLEPFRHNTSLTELQELLDAEIREYVFHDEDECAAKLRQAKQEGCRSVVGGGMVAQIAAKIGCPCVFFFPETEAILQAFRQAKQIVEVQAAERYKATRFKNVVDYSFTPIVVTSKDDRIIVFNSAAESVFGIAAKEALGKPIERVIPRGVSSLHNQRIEPVIGEVRMVGTHHLMINSAPILNGESFAGMIFSFQEASQIQSLEEKIRRVSHSKGLTAKMVFDDIIAVSNNAKEVMNRARRFAASDETILLTGETGTGKEAFAQSIHNGSRRSGRPFVAVNCATIPISLLQSELFGYAEGAFTGANRGGKKGFFELAHGGTILLDEIGELPRETQIYLLRVLQEKEIMRVGGNEVIPVDVRVVAATNERLEVALREGHFRMDLYHRLNVLRLNLPPLREHVEDILPLTRRILQSICKSPDFAAHIEALLLDHVALLHDYRWPGNIRELQNVMRRIVVSIETTQGDSVEAEIEALLYEAFDVSQPAQESQPEPTAFLGDLKSVLKNVESRLIQQKYEECKGNKTRVAKQLGIGRTTVWRKLNK